MEFKNCEYYERAISEGHCPFDCICEINCYFANNKLKEDYDYLQKEYEELENDLQDREDNEEELEELIDERDYLEEQKGVTPGQSAVFYLDNQVILGGIIKEAK